MQCMHVSSEIAHLLNLSEVQRDHHCADQTAKDKH